MPAEPQAIGLAAGENAIPRLTPGACMGGIEARSVSDGICRIEARSERGVHPYVIDVSVSAAALAVAFMSASVCMLEKKRASYWLHGR